MTFDPGMTHLRCDGMTGVATTIAEHTRFDAPQQDEKFLAWVEMNDFILEHEINKDIPGLPTRPWGAHALRVAEEYALTQISSKEETFDEAHQRPVWRLVRLIGQTFVEAFDGTWVNLPAEGSSPARVAVDLPFRQMFYLEPISSRSRC